METLQDPWGTSGDPGSFQTLMQGDRWGHPFLGQPNNFFRLEIWEIGVIHKSNNWIKLWKDISTEYKAVFKECHRFDLVGPRSLLFRDYLNKIDLFVKVSLQCGRLYSMSSVSKEPLLNKEGFYPYSSFPISFERTFGSTLFNSVWTRNSHPLSSWTRDWHIWLSAQCLN